MRYPAFSWRQQYICVGSLNLIDSREYHQTALRLNKLNMHFLTLEDVTWTKGFSWVKSNFWISTLSLPSILSRQKFNRVSRETNLFFSRHVRVFFFQVGHDDQPFCNDTPGHGSFVGLPAARALGEFLPTLSADHVTLHALQDHPLRDLQTAGALQVKFV